MRAPGSTTSRIAAVAAVTLLASGCAGPTEFMFRFETTYDPALDVRTDGAIRETGSPAPNALLNVFFFGPESIADWDGEWGLFDPVRPPRVASGSTIEVAAGKSFQVELDNDGRANVHFQRNADVVLAAWVFGDARDVPDDNCPEDQTAEYATGDEPYKIPARNATRAPIAVPFGINC